MAQHLSAVVDGVHAVDKHGVAGCCIEVDSNELDYDTEHLCNVVDVVDIGHRGWR